MITTGPQKPARATSISRRSPSISPRTSVKTDGAICQTPSRTIPKIASPPSVAARRLISDRLYGLRQKLADLARDGRQFSVFDCLHRRPRVDGDDLNTTLDFA